jgi:hypothetical protein
MAWWVSSDPSAGIRTALGEWQRLASTPVPENGGFGEGSRMDRIRWFRGRLAHWAKEQHGTWAAAAAALACDEKTVRMDAASAESADE